MISLEYLGNKFQSSQFQNPRLIVEIENNGRKFKIENWKIYFIKILTVFGLRFGQRLHCDCIAICLPSAPPPICLYISKTEPKEIRCWSNLVKIWSNLINRCQSNTGAAGASFVEKVVDRQGLFAAACVLQMGNAKRVGVQMGHRKRVCAVVEQLTGTY